MNLHEYQAKALFAEYGIPIPQGIVVAELNEGVRRATASGQGPWAVKAQIFAGSRGKAGGIKIVQNEAQLRAALQVLLGTRLVTEQTDVQGLPVDQVLIEEVCQVEKEFYLGLTLDRAHECYTFIASVMGGMDIEAVALQDPTHIHKIHINPIVGLMPCQCRQLGFSLGLPLEQVTALGQIMLALYRLFIHSDASLVEINPLGLSPSGKFLAMDAKVVVDDNALFRQKNRVSQHDVRQEDATEYAAQQLGLNYIKLAGNIGCMVNGAGLAMATMDLIKNHGGQPANFLDVGGGVTKERVASAFRIILADPAVKVVLVNIFGGIVRCDLIAEGIIAAVQDAQISVPVVVRLEGTNAEKGRVLLKNKHKNLMSAADLSDAAQKVVALALASTQAQAQA